MTRFWKRAAWFVGAMAAALACATAALALHSLSGYQKVWETSQPAIQASTNPAVIARGKYLVYGPGHCADCHTTPTDRPKLLRGEETLLTGDRSEKTFLGVWNAPNLTSDKETGLGRVTDGQLARMIRFGINRDGHIGLPFMDAYADLSEEDLIAIISFLRSLPPAPGLAPSAQINLLGKITLTYFIETYAPKTTPPEKVSTENQVRYGEYLANTVCGCRACHTARNLKTGQYLSPPFSGGLPFHSTIRPDQVYVSPNLTPDRDTGHIAAWTEDLFLTRFHAGLLIPDSPMPWGCFVRMNDTDLRALYDYLHTLPPVRRDNGPIVQSDNGRAAAGDLVETNKTKTH